MRRPLSLLALSALALGSLTLPAHAADYDAVPHLVRDANTGAASSSPEEMIVYGSRVIYLASSTSTGGELWISDGSKAGTKPRGGRSVLRRFVLFMVLRAGSRARRGR